MDQITDPDTLSARFKAPRLDKAGLLCSNHTRRLDNLRGVCSEMGRVYRSMINKKVSTLDGMRLVFVLREVRCSIEAVSAAEAIEATKEEARAAAAVQITQNSPTTVVIREVPVGHYWQSDGSFAPMSDEMLKISPAPAPAQEIEPQSLESDQEFEPQNERERRLLAELEALSPEQLLERAKQAGFVDADGL